jgi:hypothetical protein
MTNGTQSNILYNIGFAIWTCFGFPANLLIAWRLYKRRAETRPFDAAAEAFGALSRTWNSVDLGPAYANSSGRRHSRRDFRCDCGGPLRSSRTRREGQEAGRRLSRSEKKGLI